MWQMKLTQDEAQLAKQIGQRRLDAVTRENRSDIYMKANLSYETRLHYNVIGCEGEIAVSRFLGLPWSGGEPDGHKHRDVGDLVEVRTTKIRGNLIVKHLEQLKNPPSTPYVLAWSRPTRVVQLLGWMNLGDILDQGEQYEQRGIWYARIPYSNLHDMKELQCLIHS